MPSQDEQVIRQHYVPRMYLRHFCTTPKSESIWAYNKERGTAFQTNIINVAQEKYFYDFPVKVMEDSCSIRNKENPQYVEKFFGDLETAIAPLLRKIVSTYSMTNAKVLSNVQILNDHDQVRMAVYLAFQLLRTRDMRNVLTEIHEKTMTAYIRKHLPTGSLRGLRIRLEENSHAESHAFTMFDEDVLSHITSILLQQLWVVAVNRDDFPLYTSDTPVTCYNHIQGKLIMGGLGQPGVEISFPLNSELILLIREKGYFSQFLSLHNQFVSVEKEATKGYNQWQAIMADRMIFCKENRFDHARGILNGRKILRNRERVDTNKVNQKAEEWFTQNKEDNN